MGDPEGGPQPSGLVLEQAAAFASNFKKSRSIDAPRWNKAEQRTAELIQSIQGTPSSEERRKDVADYVGALIRKCFDCKVYTFGSVPLKTYLPDGDIDLTIVSRDPRLKDTWSTSVQRRLEKAQRNKKERFRVTDVQYINAEVKLIKCRVENIVVDISFNQLGGLCTLCFLEEVDQVIGQDHFFKRSIILVKAWCLYESRLLGAYNGLISTYALETLVLYIFHVFHLSLRGPLEVLLRFLEFFGKFDWHRYAVSVWGPVPLSSLPEMTAVSPIKDSGKLLLSNSFLDACLKEYAVFLNGPDSGPGRAFTAKYLNIVDPLRVGNNLGRSVNLSNFNRIPETFGDAGNKLLQILIDTSEDIDILHRTKGFFTFTQNRLDHFAPDRGARSAPARDAALHHESRQNGSMVKHAENGNGRTYRAKTYNGNGNSRKKPQELTLDFDSRNESRAGSGSSLFEGTSHESAFDNSVSVGGGSNGNSSSAHSSERRDLEPSMEDSTLRVSVTNRSSYTQTNFENNGIVRGSSESPSSESSRGSANPLSEVSSSGPLSVRRSSPNHSIEEEGFHGNGWAGEQLSYGAPNGVLDGREYVQHNGQDSFSRGPIPLAAAVIPHGQIPVTFSHAGQVPMAFTTSMALSSTNGNMFMIHAGPPPPPPLSLHPVNGSSSSITRESPIGPTPAPIQYLGIAHLRGPPAPPIPPAYYHGPPLGHYPSTMGEVPNAASTSYAVQQGDDRSFEQQQVWQQKEQIQQHDHRPKYGYLWPVSTSSSAVSPSPQQLHSEISFGISSAPALVTPGPYHLPLGSSVPRTQAGPSPPGISRISHNGSSSNLESVTSTAAGYQVSGVVQVEETGKALLGDGEVGNSTVTGGKSLSQVGSGAGSRALRNSKLGREERMSNKSKRSSTKDVADVGISEDGMPSSSADNSSYLPTQRIADDTVPSVQDYPLLHVTGRTMSPPLYQHVLPSSCPPHGANVVVSDFSSSPPPNMVPAIRTTSGHISLTSQSSSQTPPLTFGISSGSYNIQPPPVAELANGSSSLATAQRQRPVESTSGPPSVYYTTANHFPLVSMYNTANVTGYFGFPHNPDPTFINGLQLSNLSDSYSDTSAGQGDDLHLRFIQQGRLGIGERLRQEGVPTSSILVSEATDLRASNVVDPNLFSRDLLSSDFSNHLLNLDYARWCQQSRDPVPMYRPPPYLNPSTHYPDYQFWEGPGRPTTNPNMMGYGQGFGQGPPSMSNSTTMTGNLNHTGPGTYSGDELPKSRTGTGTGTGTFTPAPRPHYQRERHPSGIGRNHYGAPSQDRRDRVDREVNQALGPRHQGNGRGNNKYEPRSQRNSVSVERNNVDVKNRESTRGRDMHRQQDGPRRNPTQSSPGPNLASPSLVVSPVSAMSHVPSGVPLEMYAAPIVTSNGQSLVTSVGGTVPTVMVNPLYIANLVEFGSLGPVEIEISQRGSEADHGFGHVSGLRTQEQGNAHGLAGFSGLSVASGDQGLQGPPPKNQRVMERAYQLTEEDFPPLSFRGQHVSSSSRLNRGSSTGYVAMAS